MVKLCKQDHGTKEKHWKIKKKKKKKKIENLFLTILVIYFHVLTIDIAKIYI